MSEMFTKCNGFIVSGDPLVYADSATMTGQGTVSEPFGVKSTDLFVQEPLYTGVSGNSAYIGWNNETLLYENYTPSDTINLSEPATAFTTLKVEMSATQAPAATEYYECIPGSAFAIGKVTLIPAAQYKLQVAGAYLTASNNFQTYKVANAIRWYGNTGVAGGNDTTTLTANIKDAMYVSRIVGINRKV